MSERNKRLQALLAEVENVLHETHYHQTDGEWHYTVTPQTMANLARTFESFASRYGGTGAA